MGAVSGAPLTVSLNTPTPTRWNTEYVQVKVLRTDREPTRKHQSTGSESDSRPPFFALILPNAVFRLIHAIAVYFNHHHKQKHKINKIK